MGGLNNRHLLPYSSGDQKSEIKLLAALMPSEGYEDLLHGSLLGSGGLLGVLGVLWLVTVSLQSSRGDFPVSLTLCPKFPFSWGHNHFGLQPTLVTSS